MKARPLTKLSETSYSNSASVPQVRLGYTSQGDPDQQHQTKHHSHVLSFRPLVPQQKTSSRQPKNSTLRRVLESTWFSNAAAAWSPRGQCMILQQFGAWTGIVSVSCDCHRVHCGADLAADRKSGTIQSNDTKAKCDDSRRQHNPVDCDCAVFICELCANASHASLRWP